MNKQIIDQKADLSASSELKKCSEQAGNYFCVNRILYSE
jgi:hypothetical protein